MDSSLLLLMYTVCDGMSGFGIDLVCMFVCGNIEHEHAQNQSNETMA